MNRDHFKIKEVYESKTILRRVVTKPFFAVIYKGVEINRFADRANAEFCLEEEVAIRDDAEWAYDEALRRDGYNIPLSID